MAIEIERKFLVKGNEWRSLGFAQVYRQGYIYTHNGTTVRVRIVGNQGYLTIKGKAMGIGRDEFEYAIPVADAQEMLDKLCDRPLIEKTRYKISQGDLVWEVDEFIGENQGLIIAEVELTDEHLKIDLPNWIDQEVTGDQRYYNANLVRNPYQNWEGTDAMAIKS